MIYIFMQFLARRGREGLEDFRLNMYKKTHSEMLGLTAWVRQYAEQSKNHASDGEEIENAGQVPYLALTVRYEIVKVRPFIQFVQKDTNFNPGLFLEQSRQFYSPETTEDDYWFKTPIILKSFDIWNPKNTVLYHLNRKLGRNKVKCKISNGAIF